MCLVSQKIVYHTVWLPCFKKLPCKIILQDHYINLKKSGNEITGQYINVKKYLIIIVFDKSYIPILEAIDSKHMNDLSSTKNLDCYQIGI